jgi:hypothetical protein
LRFSFCLFFCFFFFLFEIILGWASHRTPAKKRGTTFVPNNREEIEANAGNIIQNVPSRFLTSSTITIYTCEVLLHKFSPVYIWLFYVYLSNTLHLSTCRDTYAHHRGHP